MLFNNPRGIGVISVMVIMQEVKKLFNLNMKMMKKSIIVV